MKRQLTLMLLGLVMSAFAGTALGHVPYIEEEDFSWENPFVVKKSIQQSIAVYSYLDNDNLDLNGDIDVVEFEIKVPQKFYAEVIVPVCPEYETFAPWFALVGPGLPEPEEELPFNLPEGYGAIVMADFIDDVEREFFFEFFGNKSYYQGPVLSTRLDKAGVYYVVYWHAFGESGDYVAVLGDRELWFLSDVIRAMIVTPMIRRDEELHTVCY